MANTKNEGLENDFPFQLDDFQVPWVVVWGVHFLKRSGKSDRTLSKFGSSVNKQGMTINRGLDL